MLHGSTCHFMCHFYWLVSKRGSLQQTVFHAEFLTLSENDRRLSLVTRPWQRPSLNLYQCTTRDHTLGATITEIFCLVQLKTVCRSLKTQLNHFQIRSFSRGYSHSINMEKLDHLFTGDKVFYIKWFNIYINVHLNMLIWPERVYDFCVCGVSSVPVFFGKCKLRRKKQPLMNDDLVIKTFTHRNHTHLCVCTVSERDPMFLRERRKTHLLAPPASGETMVQFFHSLMFSFIHLRTAGSAYKLSTGMSKNP